MENPTMKNFMYFILSLCLSSYALAQNKITDYDFEGIVKLNNCSGSVIRFNGQPLTAKAIVMTNGHCVPMDGGRMISPGEVLVDVAVSRTFNIFDSQMNKVKATSNKIIFATMTNTDVAYYELTATYKELEAKGVTAFLLSSERSTEGTDIQVISGYWEKGYSCSIDGFVFKLSEAGWTWLDSIRYSKPGCETIGGTSGSPIIDANSRAVIGINNTGNEDGKKCTMNNPCEINSQGQTAVKQGTSYGQQTYLIYGCLTLDFKIDLKKTNCQLPKPQSGFQNTRTRMAWTQSHLH